MNASAGFVKSQWRWAKRFFMFFPCWVALITGLNIWHDADAGQPFDVAHLYVAIGMTAFAAIVYLFSAAIFRSVIGGISHGERGK